MGLKWIGAVATLGACGRLAFDPSATDATIDGSTAIADWSLSNPYNSQDFLDSMMWIGNDPRAVAALTTPFADGFAVSIGVAILEIHIDGTIVVHDYRPAAANLGGPDEVTRIVQGATPDTAGALFVAAASWNGGDGLYRIAPDWNITREISANNISGITYDPTGAFDGIGTGTIYFNEGNTGVRRRDDDVGNATRLWATTYETGTCVITQNAIYAIDATTDNDPNRLVRIDAGTYVSTMIDQSTSIVLGQTAVGNGVIGIRDKHSLEQWEPGGNHIVLATSPDASTLWLDVVMPRAPHPLAGRIVVLEWNVATDRQRLLLMP